MHYQLYLTHLEQFNTYDWSEEWIFLVLACVAVNAHWSCTDGVK